MDNGTTVDNPADYPRIINNAGDLTTITREPRRHVVTFTDTRVPGEPEALSLPAKCDENAHARFRIHIGPKPTSGTARVILGLGENGVLDFTPIEVLVNGEKCFPKKIFSCRGRFQTCPFSF